MATQATFSLEPYSYAEARELERALGLVEPVAVTLVRRGYRTPERARAFLEAVDSHDPFEFESMSFVVERLRAAIDAGRRITVHGDYDVDGVSSTAILVRALRELDADCDWYIPDRLADGYGLSEAGVARLVERGTGLLLTADCGIASAAEVEAAKAAGIETVVTDHHEPAGVLPDCAIVHPRLSGYPCGELCGTGVAFKLAAALLGAERVECDLDLVALATVADMVPLRGENRSLVRRGLAVARRARRPGLRALCAAAGVDPARLDEGDLAFRLGPRINAAGRLYRADAGVELMLTDDEERAERIAEELDRANRERRDAERDVLAAAERARGELPEALADAPGLVLAGEGWHPGVVGIVASRLVERHGVPTVLVGLGADGRGRGSARSVPGFDLLGALRACEGHLIRCGGHAAAAGLEIRADAIDAFRREFAEQARGVLGDEPPPPVEEIDAVVGGESLGMDVAEQLERLAPFGVGNPGVRLLVPSARLADVRPMGEGERHARFTLASGSRRALGVAFGVNGSLAAIGDKPVDVSLRLELDEWNGAVSPRVVLNGLYDEPAAELSSESDPLPEADWWARLEAERSAPLEPWPAAELAVPEAAPRREVIDRQGRSGVATVASLASTGESVLALCCDARRRRGLVERAVAPARFGHGLALADWNALVADPALPLGFDHVVCVDPPPFAFLERIAERGTEGSPGYLHLAWGPGDAALAMRVQELEWPSRASLGALYRCLHEGPADDLVEGPEARAMLVGPGASSSSPELVGRSLRVLGELGLVRWERNGAHRSLGVVSSEGTELERSPAFVAYRRRLQEGIRYLSGRGQPS